MARNQLGQKTIFGLALMVVLTGCATVTSAATATDSPAAPPIGVAADNRMIDLSAAQARFQAFDRAERPDDKVPLRFTAGNNQLSPDLASKARNGGGYRGRSPSLVTWQSFLSWTRMRPVSSTDEVQQIMIRPGAAGAIC